MASTNGTNDLLIDISAPEGTSLDVPNITIKNYATDGSFETVHTIAYEVNWHVYYMTPTPGEDTNVAFEDSFSLIETILEEFIISNAPGCPHGVNVLRMGSNTLAVCYDGFHYLYDTDVFYISVYVKGDICEGDRLCISPINFESVKSYNVSTIQNPAYSLVQGTSHFENFTRISSIVMLPNSIVEAPSGLSVFLFSDESSTKTSNIQIDCISVIPVSELYVALYDQSNASNTEPVERISEDDILNVKETYKPIQELLDIVLPTFFFKNLCASYDKVESLRIVSAKIVPNPASINTEVTLQAEIEDIDYVLQYAPLFCGTFDCGAVIQTNQIDGQP